MAGFGYELIYTFLTALTVLFFDYGQAGYEKLSYTALIFLFSFCCLTVWFFRLKQNGKLIVTGILLANILTLRLLHIQQPSFFTPHIYLLLIECFFTAATSYIGARLMIRFVRIRLLCIACLFLLTVLSFIRMLTPITTGFFTALLLLLILLSDEIRLRWDKEKENARSLHMISLLPFLLLIILPAALLHFPDQPYDWKPFVAMWDHVTTAAGRIRFDFIPGDDAVIGFSDNGSLFSDLRSDEKEVLSVKTDFDLPCTLYLRGIVFDSFDGRKWTVKKTTSLPGATLDTLETLSGVSNSDVNPGDIIKNLDLNLTYLDNKSAYLFAPLKINELRGNTEKILQKDGSYCFKRYNPYRFEIRESFYILNSDNPTFASYMKNLSPPDASAWKQTAQHLGTAYLKEGCRYEDYLQYRQFIEDAYTQKIDLPPALEQELSELFKDAGSDYEKCKLLEEALGKMDYSVSTDPIPDQVQSESDFLSYFMLDGKKGYCSHFATSFVLIARSMGLPARYVQGYRVKVNKKGTYTVNTGRAHAWPEVYFEGIGWIGFEPTPGHFAATDWAMRNESETEKPEYSIPEYARRQEATDLSVPVPKPKTEKSPVFRFSKKMFFIPVVSLLLFLTMVALAGKLYRMSTYRKMNDRQKYICLSKENLHICDQLKLGIRQGETLSEFATRLEESIGENARAFIPGYEMILYGGSESILPDLSDAQQSRDALLQYLKQKRRLQYLWQKLF
ncbi:MAG: transglutaminaseTgpA domain-containing protein [Lachnospiraceae bacterium]|nr:transglutaminaseTgpA domain-containing protein [Lachnospiraceae bacterium]